MILPPSSTVRARSGQTPALRKAPQYLALPNVVAVGGSWVAPADAIASGDWSRIERLAREAAGLGLKA